ncbi:terminase TerL endonuclease subunit [Colidextribacter sp. OB.20]|uniref:terminase large subunit n=1 Tax=Colidextribacter sp. OB.20 TaxID=2304568 RepID=UPI00325F9B11
MKPDASVVDTMPEMVWLTPFIRVPVPEDGAELRYSQEAVDRVERFFSLLVFGQNEWAGKPFKLLPWQKEFIQEFFGVQVKNPDGTWVRYRRFGYEEIPKKNGKSELAAGLGLYFLLADGEQLPHVGVFAVDKVQADIIYKCAKYMVENTAMSEPKHKPLAWCRDSVREIRTKFGGLLKVYSSDVENKHGASYSAVICDELHAWSGRAGRERWEVLTVGSDAARRQQAVLVLTTAGDDPDRTSIGWEIHEKCRKILAWRRGKPELPGDGDDPAWLPIMYGVSVLTGDDPDKLAALDLQNEALWRQCNPSYGVTINPRQFRQAAREAKQSEAAERNFRWLRLNQWISVKDVGWLPLTLYDKTQIGPSKKAEREEWIREHLTGKMCFGGLDMSMTTDLTAFVLVFPPQPGLETAVALFRAWRPIDTVLEAEQRDHVPYRDWERAGFLTLPKGDMIDPKDVVDAVLEANELYDLQCVGVDQYLTQTVTPRLEEAGIQVIAIAQTMTGMSPAMKELEQLIRKHEMLHVHNSCARWCFGNVRCAVDGNENIKPMKNRSIGRIDITVAWIIAVAAWIVKRNQPPDLADAMSRGDYHL